MVTDTAPFRNPHDHTPHDLPSSLDYDRLARVVDGLIGDSYFYTFERPVRDIAMMPSAVRLIPSLRLRSRSGPLPLSQAIR
jgi:hypothetical protein